MELLVNTVRMVDHDQAREYSTGDYSTLRDNLAIGLINPEDFKKLNLTPSLNIKLANQFGNVILKVKQDKNVPEGMILMPVSIWANQITGVKNNEIIFKNIKVKVEPTRDKALDFEDLIKSIKGN